MQTVFGSAKIENPVHYPVWLEKGLFLMYSNIACIVVMTTTSPLEGRMEGERKA